MTCVIVAKIVIKNWYTEKKMKPTYCVAMTDVIMRQNKTVPNATK